MLRNPSQRNRRCFEARGELIGGRWDGLLIGSRKTPKAAENPQGDGKPSRRRKTLKETENPQGSGKPSRRRKTLKAAENAQGDGKPSRRRKTLKAAENPCGFSAARIEPGPELTHP